ncbi:lipoprotein-releasing ABC transporter permease subunit [Pseudoduganella sp. FT26W]|uniref:Lipoprotein-releasing ABC transporter permease subunit n=1 Tax=Duganella aquatilis TaxID=2666082 RepID=A0A844DA29_9BURK|nr:lipoprotein-releasing ABC transporter permease subunit [Duganella aquatilis]MRW84209.1 lipoprotein-releasing ABC transporter permease subunit [Duganella aquatilis]
MTSPYEWLIGVRYLRAGRRSGRNSFISFMSLVSIAGVGLGVAALIVVLSVMNGFQRDVGARMISVLSHIEVFDARGLMRDWQATARDAARNPAVQAAAPFAEVPGMLLQEDTMKPALLRGILPEQEAKVADFMQGKNAAALDMLKPGAWQIVLGSELAKALHVKAGDHVILAMPSQQSSLNNVMPQTRRFTVAGTFEVGHFEFDSGMAFIHMQDAEELLHVDAPIGLRLRIADANQAPQVAQALKNSLNGDYLVRDWTQRNSTWFAAVQSQKHMMFIILTLIVAVAAFNVVAMLVMSVTDKRADIAILRTLGARPSSIMKIFMVQGLLSGLMGVLAGTTLGVLIAWNLPDIASGIEHLLGVQLLDKNIYFITSVPSQLLWSDVTGVVGVAVALSFLSTLYPSWWATRTNPAEALRYE